MGVSIREGQYANRTVQANGVREERILKENIIGALVREGRAGKKMSRVALAEKVQCSKSMVQYVEQGWSYPSLALAERLRKTLSLPVSAKKMAFFVYRGPQVIKFLKSKYPEEFAEYAKED